MYHDNQYISQDLETPQIMKMDVFQRNWSV